jgi:tetratricopeptide (TPR) repeat protein
MTIDRRLVMALCAGAVSAGCAAAGTGGPASPALTSVPDVMCPGGPLQSTQWASQAQGALNRTRVLQGDARVPFYRTALEQAEAGLAADAENPYHHYLAGQAAAGLEDYATANAHLERAAALCPALVAEEIEEVRQRAWTLAFERGLAAYQAEDMEGAIRAWEGAATIWQGAANAQFNLGILYAAREDYTTSNRYYRDVLAIIDGLPASDDPEITSERVAMRVQALNGLIALGAQLFTAERLDEAAATFRSVAELEPNNRDAWYNHALTLYRMQQWTNLLPVAERVSQIDPLNYNAAIILFNAHKGIADAAAAERRTQAEREASNRALAALERAQGLPVRIDGIVYSWNADTGAVELTGTATGTGAAGGPVTLEFTVFGASGQLGTGTVTVQRPASEQEAPFSLTIPAREPVSGWRYRVM